MRRSRPRGRAGLAAGAALALLSLSFGARAREANLLPAPLVCSLRLDPGGPIPRSVTVQADTATGFWSLHGQPDGRARAVTGVTAAEHGANWSPRDAVASQVPRRPMSNLAYLEAVAGTVTVTELPGPSPEVARVRVAARSLVLEDGTRIGDLPVLEALCSPPEPPGPGRAP